MVQSADFWESDHVTIRDGLHASRRRRILRQRENLTNAHRRDPTAEHIPIDGVAIPQDPARQGAIRKGLNDLLGGTRGRGMLRDPQMHDAPTVMRQEPSTNRTRPVRVGTVKKSKDTKDIR
jgi:hypothetical protein